MKDKFVNLVIWAVAIALALPCTLFMILLCDFIVHVVHGAY